MSVSKNKSLIAYYSRKGQNYLDGRIVNLPIGNTEVVAKKIQELTGGDLFHIDTFADYPNDYTETTEVAMAEKKSNARPELTDVVDDMDAYDVIYLGYPNWWGTFPMAVFTFLESYDFSGKIIIPFCTHEGSGLGNSERDIKKVCPNATLLKGLPMRGRDVKDAKSEITKWLREIKIIN